MQSEELVQQTEKLRREEAEHQENLRILAEMNKAKEKKARASARAALVALAGYTEAPTPAQTPEHGCPLCGYVAEPGYRGECPGCGDYGF